MRSHFEAILTNTMQGVALLDADLRELFGTKRLSQLLQIPKLSVGADAATISEQVPDLGRSSA